MCRIAMISVHGSPLARLGGPESGGMNVYVRELSRELGRHGMIVDVYTRRIDATSPQVEQFADNARVIRITAGDVGPMDKVAVADHLCQFVCGVIRFAEAHDLTYQYVHSHYWLSGRVGALLSLRWQIPHVTMFHTLALIKNEAMPENVESPLRIAIERRTIATADAIVAATAHEREALVRLYGASRSRINVIPCGVDLEHFVPIDRDWARRRLELGADDEVVLFVGRPDPLKGLQVLVDAVKLLKHRSSLRVLVVGGTDADPELGRLRRLVRDYGVEQHVRLVGPVLQADLPVYYSAADVCVMPSAYESFGLVAVESLACCTPVIATKIGGLAAIVRHGENGLLVHWRCPEAFAHQIDSFFSNDELRHQLANRARDSVLHLKWETVADRVVTLYHQLGAAASPRVLCLCHH